VAGIVTERGIWRNVELNVVLSVTDRRHMALCQVTPCVTVEGDFATVSHIKQISRPSRSAWTEYLSCFRPPVENMRHIVSAPVQRWARALPLPCPGL
jgi:hypothetical protein